MGVTEMESALKLMKLSRLSVVVIECFLVTLFSHTMEILHAFSTVAALASSLHGCMGISGSSGERHYFTFSNSL
jgi:ribonucleotide reductase alpha subunit